MGGHSVQRGSIFLVSNPLPKGQWRRVRRGRGKAPPSHLLPLPPPQLAPSFVQSHTKDKGPRPAWPSAPSSLKALKETAPPSLPPRGCGAGWSHGSTGPDLSGTPNPTHFFQAPPASRSGIILSPPPHSRPGRRGATWPGAWGCGRGESLRGSPGTSPSSPPALGVGGASHAR